MNEREEELFTCTGDQFIETTELLGKMLAHMHKRDDPAPIVETIRERFGSTAAILRAGRTVWSEIGLRPNDALLFSQLLAVNRCINRFEFGNYPRMGNLYDASRYMITNTFGMQVECFYLFCVDKRGGMKERILLNRGISNAALFSTKVLLREVARVDPCSVIINHNHPSGTLRPSQEDINCTYDAIDALSILGVPLLDHVITAGREAVSLRENGFIPESIWMAQNPEHRQLQRWFLRPGEKPKKKSSSKKSSPKKKADD